MYNYNRLKLGRSH